MTVQPEINIQPTLPNMFNTQFDFQGYIAPVDKLKSYESFNKICDLVQEMKTMEELHNLPANLNNEIWESLGPLAEQYQRFRHEEFILRQHRLITLAVKRIITPNLYEHLRQLNEFYYFNIDIRFSEILELYPCLISHKHLYN